MERQTISKHEREVIRVWKYSSYFRINFCANYKHIELGMVDWLNETATRNATTPTTPITRQNREGKHERLKFGADREGDIEKGGSPSNLRLTVDIEDNKLKYEKRLQQKNFYPDFYPNIRGMCCVLWWGICGIV
jgi:hypothetical protein